MILEKYVLPCSEVSVITKHLISYAINFIINYENLVNRSTVRTNVWSARTSRQTWEGLQREARKIRSQRTSG